MMGQALDTSDGGAPVQHMCCIDPCKRRDYKQLSASLTKRLGNEAWPVGGMWNVETIKEAKRLIWERETVKKWKKRIKEWKEEAQKMWDESRHKSWIANTSRRGTEAGGVVERANGALKTKLAKLAEETGQSWIKVLPLALFEMRVTTHKVQEAQKPLLTECENESIQPGDCVLIRNWDWKKLGPRWKEPHQVLLTITTAVKVEDHPRWIHLTECKCIGQFKDTNGTGNPSWCPGAGLDRLDQRK
ncbi:uncharacterized protein LOC144611667 [Rhinoraja longicauda]